MGLQLRFKTKRFLQAKNLAYFDSVLCETWGACNRSCTFCFNNKSFEQRKIGIMPEETWYSVIDQLSEIGYKGRLSPHFYGEPLLDKRLPSLLSYARKKMPQCYIRISSNGDKLNRKIIDDLRNAGINLLFITSYDKENPKDLVEMVKDNSDICALRNFKDVLIVNRAGALYEPGELINKPCIRPARQLVIDWKGDVLMCCNDYYSKRIHGNVRNEKLLDIWNKKEYINFRKQMAKKKSRHDVEECKHCDLI